MWHLRRICTGAICFFFVAASGCKDDAKSSGGTTARATSTAAVTAAGDGDGNDTTTPTASETASPGATGAGEGVEGLVVTESDADADRVVERLREVLEKREMKIAAQVDHAAAAGQVGMDLRATTLVVFGNPRAGTPLMQKQRTVAIDLPMKILVWEGEDGRTRVAYNDPKWLVERHGIAGADERVAKMREALDSFVREATAP